MSGVQWGGEWGICVGMMMSFLDGVQAGLGDFSTQSNLASSLDRSTPFSEQRGRGGELKYRVTGTVDSLLQREQMCRQGVRGMCAICYRAFFTWFQPATVSQYRILRETKSKPRSQGGSRQTGRRRPRVTVQIAHNLREKQSRQREERDRESAFGEGGGSNKSGLLNLVWARNLTLQIVF